MKIYLKPPVRAGERFFVIRAERTEEQGSETGDDVRTERGGEVSREVSGSEVRAEFLLGLSVQDGQSRLMRISGSAGDSWNGAVALETQRELRRGRDVFVLHGVITGEGAHEAVTVWSAELHVMPGRTELFAEALSQKPLGTERRVQALAEEAWRLHCRCTDQPCGLGPVEAHRQVEAAGDEGMDWEATLMIPDGWEGQTDEG